MSDYSADEAREIIRESVARDELSEAARRLSERLDPDLRDGWTILPDDLLDDFRAVIAATRRWKAKPFTPDWDMGTAARRVKAREDAASTATEQGENRYV